MRTRADRLRSTAAIGLVGTVQGGVAYLLGLYLSLPEVRLVAQAVVLVVWLVFAPLYYFVASWRDETAALEAERSRRGG